MPVDWCSTWLMPNNSWSRRYGNNAILPAAVHVRSMHVPPASVAFGNFGLRLQAATAAASTENVISTENLASIENAASTVNVASTVNIAAEEEHHHSKLDFSELGKTGTYGSAVADLHAALRAYQEGDYKLASLKVMTVAAALTGLEDAADFLEMVQEGSELRDLLNSEQYLSLLAKLVRLIPPTGEPEIDILLGLLKSLELVRLRQSWQSAVAGEYREAAGQLAEAVMPRSLKEAVSNTRPATVAPVVAGLVAGWYGYTGRFGRGVKSNFFLASFTCTATIRAARAYWTRLAAAEAHGRQPLYTGWDEHLLLT